MMGNLFYRVGSREEIEHRLSDRNRLEVYLGLARYDVLIRFDPDKQFAGIIFEDSLQKSHPIRSAAPIGFDSKVPAYFAVHRFSGKIRLPSKLQTQPYTPGLSQQQLEERVGCEYTSFTLENETLRVLLSSDSTHPGAYVLEGVDASGKKVFSQKGFAEEFRVPLHDGTFLPGFFESIQVSTIPSLSHDMCNGLYKRPFSDI
ncbi:MAG: hypothetical protein ACMXYF_05410 [Candidatus Woesearchaeota archaeon]